MTADPGAAPAAGARPRSAKRQFGATILALEAFVVVFGTLVAYGLRLAPAGVVFGVGLGLAVLLLLASGLVGRPGGYVVGWVVQALVLACGFVLPMMFVMGGVFVVLWAVAVVLGGRIDAERADWAAQQADAGQ